MNIGEITFKFVEFLLNESIAMLSKQGQTPHDAERLALEFIRAYGRKISGAGHIYFKKDMKLRQSIKQNNIRSDFFSGSTVLQLAEKYEVSTIYIYKILRNKNQKTLKPDTSDKAQLLIEAGRMFIQSGLGNEDATSAARGLVAVIMARFAGITISNPARNIEKIIRNIHITRLYLAGKSLEAIAARFDLSAEETAAIIKNYPARKPSVGELPKIKRQLASITGSFSEYAAIHATENPTEFKEVINALGVASEQICRAEQILKRLEG